ncbi:MAG: peptide-methionine (R)-S-oxide reductase MsrB [Acidobacteria bacterium]|nr:peptide-methionine (R)-S-oxide reductase MsrB [Acidobacteriota bacterium]
MTYEVTKTDSEWRAALDPDEFEVLRESGTERPWSGALLDEHRDGIFRCRACDAALFASTTKFDSGSGWPSFFEPVSPDAVVLHDDSAWGMRRTEVLCARCGSHMGHLFDDAPQTPTGDRFCMNSVSMVFRAQAL